MSFFIELLRSIWNFIKKIILKVINFAKNIISFFKNPQRLKKLKQNSNLMAIAIKVNLDNGQYKVVNCLYDKVKNEVVEEETDAVGIEAEKLDKETKQHFGNTDMIILN